MIASIAVDSPIGRLTISANREAIVSIGWDGAPSDEATALLLEARHQLEAYFAGRLARFDLPLEPAGSAFNRKVWEAMRQIPYGQTRSYGELAMTVGTAPRAIGRACGKNPIPIVIPCHRVLARSGLGGYSGGAGLPTKTWLLELESADRRGLSSPAIDCSEQIAAAAPSIA